MRKDFTTKRCKHQDLAVSYTHVRCKDCDAIGTDVGGEWGIGKQSWFDSMEVAKFYAKNGYLPQQPNAKN